MSREPAPLSPGVLERLGGVSTPTLSTQLMKLGFRNVFLHGVRRLNPGPRMVGEARTVRFVPAREDLATWDALGDPDYPQRWAIEHVARGQVLVMECRGVRDAAAAGEILVARLRVRGAAGLVLDGGIRDWEGVGAQALPVYALGPSAPAHLARHLAVAVDVPIGCAEVLIVPGDVLVGDAEGVVCVPRGAAETVAARGIEQEELEAFLLEKIQGGAALPGTYPPNAATLEAYQAWQRARRG